MRATHTRCPANCNPPPANDAETLAAGAAASGPAIVIRGGGVGDFLLAVPLLAALRRRHRRVLLVSRPAYHALVQPEALVDELVEVDGTLFGSLFGEPAPSWRRWLPGATVYTYQPDPGGDMTATVRRLGGVAVRQLDPRPTAPPHQVEQAFAAAGVPWTAATLTTAWLAGATPTPGDGPPQQLWLHPGSGDPRKNAPLTLFVAAAEQWLAAGGRGVTVSLGDADAALAAPARRAMAHLPIGWVTGLSLPALRARLAGSAPLYMGNDSGVGHLAGLLGLRCLVWFLATDPAIWAPLGPRVTCRRLAAAATGSDAAALTAWLAAARGG